MVNYWRYGSSFGQVRDLLGHQVSQPLGQRNQIVGRRFVEKRTVQEAVAHLDAQKLSVFVADLRSFEVVVGKAGQFSYPLSAPHPICVEDTQDSANGC